MAHDKKPYESHEVVDKILHAAVDTLMTPRDQCVRATANAVTTAITLTLPPVGDCRGLWFAIVTRDADNVNTVTIQDQDESENWPGDIVFDGPRESILLWSDGYSWHQCCQVGATGSTSPSATPSTSPSGTPSTSPSASPSGTATPSQ